MSIGQRIKELISNKELTQDSFALQTGVTRQTINNAVKGKNSPSGEVLSKILASYPEVNARWLLTGVGEIYKSNGYIDDKQSIESISEPESIYSIELRRNINSIHCVIPE